jgi:hypothetical protein
MPVVVGFVGVVSGCDGVDEVLGNPPVVELSTVLSSLVIVPSRCCLIDRNGEEGVRTVGDEVDVCSVGLSDEALGRLLISSLFDPSLIADGRLPSVFDEILELIQGGRSYECRFWSNQSSVAVRWRARLMVQKRLVVRRVLCYRFHHLVTLLTSLVLGK